MPGGQVPDQTMVLDRQGLDALLGALADAGYEVIGPTVVDGAIAYRPVQTVADLPAGWRDEQSPGGCRLVARSDNALFGHVNGAQGWKPFLHPPEVTVWSGRRTGDGVETVAPAPVKRRAFVGVRPCDLAAIAIQDRVLLDGPVADDVYAARRSIFVVAVNCTEPGATCFCASLGTGPSAASGFDVVLTELVDEPHRFVAEAGSARGMDLLAASGAAPADDVDRAAAGRMMTVAAGRMGRTLATGGVRELLYANARNPRWEQVARRCLTCTICTMVCPTCFCTSMRDGGSFDGQTATRTRIWDSCFGIEFSYLHGGSVRSSSAARYRQWLTHKLASWQDQFGIIGCVGCGRCITWCPVGIDITEEVHAIADSDVRSGTAGQQKEATR